MKNFKTFLKWILATVVVLILLILGFISFVLYKPEVVWSWVERYVVPEDVELTWSHLDFHPEPQGIFHWRPRWDMEKLCIRRSEPYIDICVDNIEWLADLRFTFWRLTFLEVETLRVESEYSNRIRPAPGDGKPSKEESSFYEIIDDWRSKISNLSKIVKINDVYILVRQLEVLSNNGKSLVTGLEIVSDDFLNETELTTYLSRDVNFEFQLKGKIRINSFLEKDGSIAEAEGQLRVGEFLVDWLPLSLNWENEKVLLNMLSQLRFGKRQQALVNLQARLNSQNLSIEGDADIRGLHPKFLNRLPVRAKAQIPQEKGRLWARSPSTAQVETQVPLYFIDENMKPPLEKSCRCSIPERLGAWLNGTFYLHDFFQEGFEGSWADLDINLENLTNGLLSLESAVSLELLRQNKENKIRPTGSVLLTIHSFKGLVNFLNSQDILIPAPLSVLDGQIVFRMNEELTTGDFWRFPYQADVNLKSKDQVVKAQTRGRIDYATDAKNINIISDFVVSQLVLELPPLEPFGGLPKFVPDPRFKKQPEAPQPKNDLKVSYDIQITTTESDSIQLLSALAKPFVPIGLQVSISNVRPVEGQVHVSDFEINYLRRNMFVEKVDLALNDPVGIFPVNGRFRIDQNPYKIFVDILGQARQPQIQLSSDPYLPRSDIISVLLYGRESDDLVTADQDTVGSFDAAMADRAIGILGLFAFSSTPIQSFSYNQLNQQYAARLAISDDTSVTLGTNWDETTLVEVQKRISRRWMISASTEPTANDEQLQKVRLQWENRF